MKKFLILLVSVLLLTITACSSKKEPVTENNSQTTNEVVMNDKGEKGYYDGEGYFWLSDGSGYYDSEGNFITTKAAETNEPAAAEMFSKEIIGNYGSKSIANVIVEANRVTIQYERATYTIPAAGCTKSDGEGTDISYDFSVEEIGAQGTLTFYEDADIDLQVEVTYSDNSGTELSFTAARSYVLDNMPLEGYVSLDSQGEFGAIAMTEDVRKLLLEGMTEDYVIYYHPDQKAITYDSSDNSIEMECEWYSIISFDENGEDSSECYTIDVYNFKTESDATAYYNYKSNEEPNLKMKQSGTAVVERVYDAMITDFYNLPGGKDTKVHGNYLYKNESVYGEHCSYNKSDNEYAYYSKPYTIEEGKLFNETTAFMRSFFCYETPSTDGQYTLELQGNVHENSITVKDPNGYTLIEGNCFVKKEGNTLLAYKYDLTSLYTNVAEFIPDGNSISVKCYRYDGTGEITCDNYKGAKAVQEAEFVISLTK